MCNWRRVFRLIDEAIDRLALDLSGLRVLTEAASGAFAVTALIAARAGAMQVRAVTRDSAYGSALDVIEYGRAAAIDFGVADRITFTTAVPSVHATSSDVVTNLGFVRPIDHSVIERLPRHAVVCLMWEPWELRTDDVDLGACIAAEIPVIGTNEHDPRVGTFAYLGPVVLKLLFEARVEGLRSRILLVGSDPFGAAIERTLRALEADVIRVAPADVTQNLDDTLGAQVEAADAVVLAEHRDMRELVGHNGGIHPRRFSTRGCSLIHLAGRVDGDALHRAGIQKHPARPASPGYMAATTDYVGPKPVIDLHAAGLAVGSIACRCRLAGGTVPDAIAAAEASGLGLRIPMTPPR
jgi:hypothetical protein